MNIDEAIDILKNKYEELYGEKSDLRDALLIAISALCIQNEEQRLVPKGYERCGYVQFSESFAKSIKPHKGCHTGPKGIPHIDIVERHNSTPYIQEAVKMLKSEADNIMRGADEQFICVSTSIFYHCLSILVKKQEATKNDPLTLENLISCKNKFLWIVPMDISSNDTWHEGWYLCNAQVCGLKGVEIPQILRWTDYGEKWRAYDCSPTERTEETH